MEFRMSKDIGNGTDKCAVVLPDGTMRTSVIPNVVGVGEMDLGALDLGGMQRRRRRGLPEPYAVTYDGIANVLTGPRVRAYCKEPIRRTGDPHFSDTMETRCVTYASSHDLLGPGIHQGYLVLGVPVDKLKTGVVKKFKREVKRWLVGEHKFSVNGEESVVTINGIQFAAQPVGAFMEWGMSHQGQWARSEAEFLQDTGVVDVGYQTIDLFVVSEGQVSPMYTSGNDLGIGRAVDRLVETVEGMHSISMSAVEADELIIRYLAGRGRKKIEIVAQGQDVDITPIVKTALDAHGGAIVDFIGRAWRNIRLKNILLTGGGCLAFGDRLMELYPYATLLEDPITANARGLAKLAQRIGRR